MKRLYFIFITIEFSMSKTRHMRFVFYFLPLLFISQTGFSQNCSFFIERDQSVNGIHFVRTKVETILRRGTTNYKMQFFSDSNGLFIDVFSSSSSEFNEVR